MSIRQLIADEQQHAKETRDACKRDEHDVASRDNESHNGAFSDFLGRRSDALRTRVHVGECQSLSARCKTGTEARRSDKTE